jgi:hypothetical protein
VSPCYREEDLQFFQALKNIGTKIQSALLAEPDELVCGQKARRHKSLPRRQQVQVTSGVHASLPTQ